MQRFKDWLSAITLGQEKRYLRLSVWTFFDNMALTIPHGVMLMAAFAFLGPVSNPFTPIPVKRILILCLILAIQAVCYYFIAKRTYISTCTSFAQATRESRLKMGEQLRRLPMGFFKSRDAAELSTILLRDYHVVESTAAHSLPFITVALVRLVMGIILLGIFDWRMMLASILVIPLSIPFVVFSAKRIGSKSKDLMEAQQENTGHILEYVGGIQTLKAFNHSGTMFEKTKDSCEKVRKKSLETELAAAPLSMLARSVLNSGTAVVMVTGVFLLTRSSLSPFSYIAFLMVAVNFYTPIMELFYFFVDLSRMNYCAARIQGVFQEKFLPFHTDVLAGNKGDIRFKNVSFSYGNGQVLQEVSFHIPKNSFTALVGPSGSGKSTVIRLIARFWDINSGEITLGDTLLHELNPDTILQEISMVFQDVYLFRDTVANNIRMGKPDAGEEEIIDAAKRAACHDFIMQLPKGYQTVVGEGGSTLSGGEKQRISIARAFLKNAPVILLDEATASLDPENEMLVQQAIGELVQDKTVVVIAHRLNSIQYADQILVLEKGKIVESGVHDSLLLEGGLYKTMWDEQQKAGNWCFGNSKEEIDRYDNTKGTGNIGSREKAKEKRQCLDGLGHYDCR